VRFSISMLKRRNSAGEILLLPIHWRSSTRTLPSSTEAASSSS
jgi:hypothetical protein